MFLPDKKKPVVFPIVCIGGSAGSVSAYLDILREMPARTGMAIVIVSHRALEDSGRLIALLRKVSQMKVVDVTDGMILEPDRVYLGPPHRQMTTDGVALRLAVGFTENHGWPTIISECMDSLASECNSRVIAIILSGMGNDGSSALAAVKKGGGRTLAQLDACHFDMPQAAMATDWVDFVLRASQIGRYLASLSAELRLQNA